MTWYVEGSNSNEDDSNNLDYSKPIFVETKGMMENLLLLPNVKYGIFELEEYYSYSWFSTGLGYYYCGISFKSPERAVSFLMREGKIPKNGKLKSASGRLVNWYGSEQEYNYNLPIWLYDKDGHELILLPHDNPYLRGGTYDWFDINVGEWRTKFNFESVRDVLEKYTGRGLHMNNSPLCCF